MENVGTKKRKKPTPIFIAAAGNRHTTARFLGRGRIWCGHKLCGRNCGRVFVHMGGYRIGTVVRIACFGQRRNRGDTVI